MKKKNFVFFFFLLFFSLGYSEGLQNQEQNASAMGNAYAGVAAAVKDASIGFYNPAGLILFDTREVNYSTVALDQKATLKGNSLWQSHLMLSNTPAYLQDGTANSHKTQYFPAFNEVVPFHDR